MSEEQSIIDIVNKVGIENITVQAIHQSSPDVRLVKRRKELRITFSSELQDVMHVAKGERIGLVVWFDREKLGEAPAQAQAAATDIGAGLPVINRRTAIEAISERRCPYCGGDFAGDVLYDQRGDSVPELAMEECVGCGAILAANPEDWCSDLRGIKGGPVVRLPIRCHLCDHPSPRHHSECILDQRIDTEASES